MPGRSKSTFFPGPENLYLCPVHLDRHLRLVLQNRHHRKKEFRKRPLLSVMRKNQETYNIFITKKVPKRLKALDVDSNLSD